VQDWKQEEARLSHFKNHSARCAAAGPVDTLFPDRSTPPGHVPGPGTYNLQDVLSLKHSIEGRLEKRSAAFCPVATHRRGEPAEETPGPGMYDTRIAAVDPLRAVAAPFVSTVRFFVKHCVVDCRQSFNGGLAHAKKRTPSGQTAAAKKEKAASVSVGRCVSPLWTAKIVSHTAYLLTCLTRNDKNEAFCHHREWQPRVPDDGRRRGAR
jgi:hypothetical protein